MIEILFGWLLVVLLLGLGGYFAWKQLGVLRSLPAMSLPDEELQYERRKARRRLVSGVLLALMGVLLVVQLVAYEPTARVLAEDRPAFGEGNSPTDEQKLFLRIWVGGWIALLLVLLAVVVIAGIDMISTRRFGLRQYRKIQADRRAMIQRQVARMRQERNGEGA